MLNHRDTPSLHHAGRILLVALLVPVVTACGERVEHTVDANISELARRHDAPFCRVYEGGAINCFYEAPAECEVGQTRCIEAPASIFCYRKDYGRTDEPCSLAKEICENSRSVDEAQKWPQGGRMMRVSAVCSEVSLQG